MASDDKYTVTLTGAQVDDALLQMNQRIPEGWAVGTRDGNPVSSTSQFYHNNAKYLATQSKSWAVGGTGERSGEDTNNAKYWSNQAQAAAGGGVSSFKGRTGAVQPQAGDYTAVMVGALPDSVFVPQKTSELVNDAGFIGSGDLSDFRVYAGQAEGYNIGANATAEGDNNKATGTASHAEGVLTTASALASHAEGNRATASGNHSHAEGYGTTASSRGSHAEGFATTASGQGSHAEGVNCTASGYYSHAEGADCTASGYNAHAEGDSSSAVGDQSHAEGLGTIANKPSQHVVGRYNIADESASITGDYVEIVGNGTTANIRSNARTLDWSGNEVLAGKLTVGAAPTANMDVATKKYVDDAIAAAIAALQNS